MATRAATRSSVQRDLPSSPSKPSVSETPVRRTTRATRSQSRELGDDDTPAGARRTRGTRQGSAESMESTGATRKSTRAKNARAAADLPVVDEDVEVQAEGRDDADNEEQNLEKLRSPDARSDFSGTTALTSHSAQELSDLDTSMIVDILPALHRSTTELIGLLAPPNVTTESLQNTIQQLQVPGSRKGNRLRYMEKNFENAKENYGSDYFINASFILKKLFNEEVLEKQDYRPEVIIHEANIAILVKSILVAQQEKPETFHLLQRLDDSMPSLFLTEFSSEVAYGSSNLLPATFDLGLALRTQVAISALKEFNDDSNYQDYDPDQLLGQVFYEPSDQRDKSLSSYDDLVVNGRLRRIAGIDVDTTNASAEDVADLYVKVKERLDVIRSAINREPEAIEDGDYVDFDRLIELFPWDLFLEDIVQWSQLRMEEIEKCIEAQGGIDRIAASLAEKVQNADSQIELGLLQTKAVKEGPHLLPPAEIVPASSSGTSFYNSPRSVRSFLRRLLPFSSAPQPTQESTSTVGAGQPSTPQTRHVDPPERASAPAKITDAMREAVDDFRPVEDYDDPQPQGRSTEELVEIHAEGVAYMNKENRPVKQQGIQPTARKSFFDRQANAEKVTWSQPDDDSQPSPGPRKRTRDEPQAVNDEEEDDDDDAFQTDQAPVDQSRRKAQVSGQSRTSPKRVRIAEENIPREEEEEEEEQSIRPGTQASSRTRESIPPSSQPRSSGAASHDPEFPPYSQVNEAARVESAKVRAQAIIHKTQRRTPWSEYETERLLQMIEKYGCRWSTILKEGQVSGLFEDRDQVALKDKARNIKVDFLISGTVFRPNFDGIALGKKEKDKVRAAGYNPYRLEGERAGEESQPDRPD